MSTISVSSLYLPSLKPKNTFHLSAPKPTFLPLSLYPYKPLSLSTSFSPSLLVRNVALSSELDQEEDFLSDVEEPSFSPDLKVFVGNLPFSVDSAQLAGLFESAGNIEMVEVIYEKETGRSRGFGFVTMSSAEEAKAAAKQFNGYELAGRYLRVNAGPAPPKRDGPPPRMGSRGGADSSNRVYVGNLSWDVDDIALRTLFSEQGKVLEARVVYDRESGRSRGFGFVSYGSAAEVNSAIESLDSADLNGRAIRVTVAESKPRHQF